MKPGDLVSLRDESWIVAGSERYDHCTVWTLEGRGPENAGLLFRAITPFDRLAVQASRPRRRKRQAVLRRALGAIAGDRPAGGLWTAATANLDLLAYQLEPALAVLRGATRILLADAVGLGKTVQAGLILAELRARGLVERALILCPSGLREVWVHELRERFQIAAAPLDHVSIALGLHELPAGVNPWSAHPVVVASIDLVKRPEVLAAVEEVAFDLVIADEAHHLTPASDRGRAVSRLGSRAPWLVLASATPHSGDQPAFDYLAALGALGDSLAVFRRSRQDVGLPAERRTRLLRVTPTADEAQLLRATDDYSRSIWQARGRLDRAVQLVAITLARRAASSAMALANTLTRRRSLLSETPMPPPEQVALPWDADADAEDELLDERLARPGLQDAAVERRQLDTLIHLAHCAAAHNSKLLCLRRLLYRSGEPAVIFTEYRDTLHDAATALGAAFRLGVVHGGVPTPLRHEVVAAFERGELDLLLATDTAGEGLNLHRRCRLVVDLELPWNPRRLEQRIGRVDRIGQRRRVHAVHLLHRGSIEERVWGHLEHRRTAAEEAMGDDTASTEEDMARAIFEEVSLPRPGSTAIVTMRVDAAAELARVSSQRRWRRDPVATGDRPCFALPRHNGADWTAVALHEQAVFRATGGLCERRLHATTIRVGGAATVASVRTAAMKAPPADGDADAINRPGWHSVLGRIFAARRLLAAQPAMHQASLFDRRAERDAHLRRDVIAQLDAALARRAQSLADDSLPSHPRLIALWPRSPKS